MSTVGSMPAASAWTTCARPISSPVLVTNELSDMFCALKGATRSPLRAKIRQRAAARKLLPADEPVPCSGDGHSCRDRRDAPRVPGLGCVEAPADARAQGARCRISVPRRVRGSSRHCLSAGGCARQTATVVLVVEACGTAGSGVRRAGRPSSPARAPRNWSSPRRGRPIRWRRRTRAYWSTSRRR